MKNKLKPCPACGKEIFKGARTCPQCGKKFTTWSSLILALIIGLVIAGFLTLKTCGNAAALNESTDEAERELLRYR